VRAPIFLLFVATPLRDYMPLWQWPWSMPNTQLLSKVGIALSSVSKSGCSDWVSMHMYFRVLSQWFFVIEHWDFSMPACF
jgi:hypothetical protein